MFTQGRHCTAEGRCHDYIDFGNGVRDSQRKVLLASGWMSERIPEKEHVIGSVGEESQRVAAFRVLEDAFQRQKTVRCLEARHAAIRSGAEYRASRLRADGKRYHSRRH